MIEVKYYGGNRFRIREKRAQIFLGLPESAVKSDVFLLPGGIGEQNSKNLIGKNREKPFIISGPGEYEVAGVEVWGGNNGYWLIRIGNWRFCFISGDWKVPDEKKTAKFEQLDLLFLTLKKNLVEVKDAVELIKRISPLIVIPGVDPSLKDPSWKKVFLDAMDREDLKPQGELKIEKSDLPEETTVVLLGER
ncbi:MAG: MBL fold metallo-hydrolase [Patescibacteria group bacterium]